MTGGSRKKGSQNRMPDTHLSYMRFVAILLTLVACSSLHAAEQTLEAKSVLDGKVSLLIPQNFKPMSEEMLTTKYPSERRPTLVYTNEPGSVNLALNHTRNRMPASQLAAFHKSMEGNLKRLYPSAEWFRSEVRKIHGREFFIMELRTPAIDTEVRNIMLGTSLDDRLLLISFNVTKELEREWLATASRIIESVEVK
jgi:hypothetical protein